MPKIRYYLLQSTRMIDLCQNLVVPLEILVILRANLDQVKQSTLELYQKLSLTFFEVNLIGHTNTITVLILCLNFLYSCWIESQHAIWVDVYGIWPDSQIVCVQNLIKPQLLLRKLKAAIAFCITYMIQSEVKGCIAYFLVLMASFSVQFRYSRQIRNTLPPQPFSKWPQTYPAAIPHSIFSKTMATTADCTCFLSSIVVV